MKSTATFYQLAIFSLCALASALLTGCTTPPQSKAMTPVGIKAARQHPVSVVVHAEGGNKTEEGMPAISNSEFRSALLAAINESRVFAAVRDQPPADYRVSASLVSTKCKGALTLEITQAVRWQLTRLSDNAVLLNEFVTSTGTATAGDAIVGLTRARMALERAAQENIKQGLLKLSELELRQP